MRKNLCYIIAGEGENYEVKELLTRLLVVLGKRQHDPFK